MSNKSVLNGAIPVQITDPQDGELIVYDSTIPAWKNGTGGGNPFDQDLNTDDTPEFAGLGIGTAGVSGQARILGILGLDLEGDIVPFYTVPEDGGFKRINVFGDLGGVVSDAALLPLGGALSVYGILGASPEDDYVRLSLDATAPDLILETAGSQFGAGWGLGLWNKDPTGFIELAVTQTGDVRQSVQLNTGQLSAVDTLSFTPNTDNTIDLGAINQVGSTNYRWRNGYFSGSVTASAYTGASLSNTVSLLFVTDTDGSPKTMTMAEAGTLILPDGLTLPDGGYIAGDTTTGHTWKLQAYDTNSGPALVTFATFTNGNLPSLVISPPSGGGTVALKGTLATSENAVTGLTAGVLAALTTASIVITDGTGQVYRVPCVI